MKGHNYDPLDLYDMGLPNGYSRQDYYDKGFSDQDIEF